MGTTYEVGWEGRYMIWEELDVHGAFKEQKHYETRRVLLRLLCSGMNWKNPSLRGARLTKGQLVHCCGFLRKCSPSLIWRTVVGEKRWLMKNTENFQKWVYEIKKNINFPLGGKLSNFFQQWDSLFCIQISRDTWSITIP